MTRGRGKVRVSKKNGGVSADELGNVFNQLLGDEKSLDPVIVMDKYNKLISNIDTIKKLLDKFKENILINKFSENKTISSIYVGEINDFIEKCDDVLSLKADLSNVIHVYREIKNNDLIKTILYTCKKLLPYAKHLEDVDSLNESFIHNSIGITIELFSFTKLNFKTIFNSPMMGVDNKKYVLIVLSMIFTKSYDIYNLVTSPDIDIDKFSKVIIDSIQQAKKVIPRCDKAFRKIARSVDLLKNNFNGYYKDFIESESPTIILEHFILDLSKDLDSDAETIRQFKRIVMHYQKRYNECGKNSDPKLSQMFNTINEKFKLLETDDDSDDGIEEVVIDT